MFKGKYLTFGNVAFKDCMTCRNSGGFVTDGIGNVVNNSVRIGSGLKLIDRI